MGLGKPIIPILVDRKLIYTTNNRLRESLSFYFNGFSPKYFTF